MGTKTLRSVAVSVTRGPVYLTKESCVLHHPRSTYITECVHLLLAAAHSSPPFLDSVAQYIHNRTAFPDQPWSRKPKGKTAKDDDDEKERDALTYSRAWASVTKCGEMGSSSFVVCVNPKKITEVEPEVKHRMFPPPYRSTPYSPPEVILFI